MLYSSIERKVSSNTEQKIKLSVYSEVYQAEELYIRQNDHRLTLIIALQGSDCNVAGLECS